MEDASLNKAHQQERRAEVLLRHKKFDDCIECHKKAIELLMETTTLTENVRALESITLQIKYHEKQMNFVRLKKIEQEQHKKAAEEQKRREELESEEAEDNTLEAVFYRTFQVHDSLIDYLGKRGTGSDNDSLKSYSTSDTEEKTEKDSAAQVIGNKHPKDDAQIIEELKMLSGQLRSTVQCLLVELDDRNKEIEKLKDKIKVLEDEKEKAQTKNNSSLKVITDSSGGTSPYVFSPCSELSPDVVNEPRILPPLAPLEMPNFDFLNLYKNSSNKTNTN